MTSSCRRETDSPANVHVPLTAHKENTTKMNLLRKISFRFISRDRDSTALSAVDFFFALKTCRRWHGLVDTVKLLGAVRGTFFSGVSA